MEKEMDMNDKILSTIQKSVEESISTSLTAYNSPLRKMCDDVLEKNSEEIRKLIDEEFSTLLDSGEFKLGLKEALNKKLAKVLITRMGGELESQVNKLKADPRTRAEITVAINRVIKDCTSN